MEIDVIKSENLTVSEESPFFGGELISELSFGLELPLSDNNKGKFNIFSPIDIRKTNIGVTAIDSNIKTTDGTLHLDSIDFEENKISATLYLNEELSRLLNSPIREINPDDHNSIVAWHSMSYYGRWNTISGQDYFASGSIVPYYVGIEKEWFPNNYRKYRNAAGQVVYNSGCQAFYRYQYHPSIYLRTLFEKLVTYSDNTFAMNGGSVDEYGRMRIVATRKEVCPQNEIQWIYLDGSNTKYPFASIPRTAIPIVIAGQHIANDGEGKEGDALELTFNRPGRITISDYCFELKASGDAPGSISVVLYDSEDNAVSTLYQVQATNLSEDSSLYPAPTSATALFDVGYKLRVEVHGSSGTLNAKKLKVWLKCSITEYEITEDDYGQSLEYFSGVSGYIFSSETNYQSKIEEIYHPAWWSALRKVNDTFAWQGELPCFSYFGIYTNLGELTYGDLLMNWCCQTGQILHFEPNKMELRNFTISDALTSKPSFVRKGVVELLNDNFGRYNVVKYGNDVEVGVVEFADANLEAKKDIISLAVGVPNVEPNKTAYYPQYTGDNYVEGDYKYPPQSVQFNDLPPFISYNYTSLKFAFNQLAIKGNYSQIATPYIYNFEVAGIVNLPFIEVDGFVYWIVSSEKDIENKVTNIKAVRL